MFLGAGTMLRALPSAGEAPSARLGLAPDGKPRYSGGTQPKEARALSIEVPAPSLPALLPAVDLPRSEMTDPDPRRYPHVRNSTAVAIAAAEAREDVKRLLLVDGSTLEERLTAAMKRTYRHWMATDEDDQFLAACEAVYALATPDEQERMEVELRGLAAMSAMLGGVAVDLSAIEIPADPIGLRRLWMDVTA